MKKVLSLFLAVAMIIAMVVFMSVPVSAEEDLGDIYGYIGDSEQYGSGEISFSYESRSTFMLKIPLVAYVDFPNYISAYYPNLAEGYQIEILVTNIDANGCVPVTNVSTGRVSRMLLRNDSDDYTFLGANNNKLATFTLDDFDFASSPVKATSEFSIMPDMDAGYDAGENVGTICYRVECNRIPN